MSAPPTGSLACVTLTGMPVCDVPPCELRCATLASMLENAALVGDPANAAQVNEPVSDDPVCDLVFVVPANTQTASPVILASAALCTP